jgi:CheY-like chemotaxis protein
LTHQGSSSENAKRILVVDDDPDILQLIAVLLRSEGYLIDTATGGEECLEQTAKNPPDLIILDIMMPKMNGAQVARKLKANPTTDAIPIIFLTALTEKKYVKAALFELGIEFYVTKPFDQEDLIDKIQQAIRYRRVN